MSAARWPAAARRCRGALPAATVAAARRRLGQQLVAQPWRTEVCWSSAASQLQSRRGFGQQVACGGARSEVPAAEAKDAEPAEGELDFSNAQVAFESKSTFELFRTWVVFQTCAIGWIVRHCDSLYGYSLKILGPRLTHGVLRYSLFNHFCAGESAAGIQPRMEHLRSLGVGGILDYAAEAKDDALPKAEKPVDEEATVGAPLSARKYEYNGEAICDANAEIFLDAIRAVHDTAPEGFAAIKLSGLGDPKLLERMSTCLVEMTRLFYRLSQKNEVVGVEQTPYYCIDRSFRLDWDEFSTGWKKLFKVESEEALRAKFNEIDSDGDGVISFIEWSETMKLSSLNELVQSCIKPGPMYNAALNEEEIELYMNLVNRLYKILDLSKELGVRVMVDAEWIDIQPAIDHIVLFQQRKYNTGPRPVVFQTYQTYLKGMHYSALRDLERSQREGWRFGAKVVRGAYMVSEREKARVRGVESPVCDTYEETEAHFHSTIDSILRHNTGVGTPASDEAQPGEGEAEILIASHNQDSVDVATRLMKELGKDMSTVHFGQLMGMADHLTFTLAKHGYKAYKYVPYGPIDEVVPYLIRRTQENSAILGSPGVQAERGMVGQELRRRLLPFC